MPRYFEKGNQAARGLENSGRPQKYDRVEYAKLLDDWSETKDAVNIMQFCAKYNLEGEYISRWAKESDEFSQSLNRARAKLCARQSELVQKGKYDWRDYNRQLGYYNKVIQEFDREELAYEYGLKKGLENKETNITINNIEYTRAKADGE
jgi:hypothetical protein